jgi:sortase A
VLGIVLIAAYGLIRLHGFLWNYASSEALALTAEGTSEGNTSPDFSLWDSKRIEAYKDSLIKKFDPPLAVLRIDRIGIRVAMFEGVDELTLNRGVGHIPGTSLAGKKGNIGIAGHRDGFFRGLKDLVLGDKLQIITSSNTYTYKVDQLLIVDPTDVSVLDPGPTASVTLVTCYPFYFIGHAPQRYIIKASLQESIRSNIGQN